MDSEQETVDDVADSSTIGYCLWQVDGPQYGSKVITLVVKNPKATPSFSLYFDDAPAYLDKPPQMMMFTYERKNDCGRWVENQIYDSEDKIDMRRLKYLYFLTNPETCNDYRNITRPKLVNPNLKHAVSDE